MCDLVSELLTGTVSEHGGCGKVKVGENSSAEVSCLSWNRREGGGAWATQCAAGRHGAQ